MKNLLFLCFLIVLWSLTATAGDLTREFKTASGKTVEIDLKSGGDITITGKDGDGISVKVHYRREDDREPKVDFEETSSGLRISTGSNRRHRHREEMTFDISVPRKTNFDIESMGGAIAIDGVEGRIEGSTMGGELNLSHLKGKLDLRTMGGDVRLTSSDVDGEVKTNGGKVTVKDVTGGVNAHSMGGAVSYENVTGKDGASTGEEVNITTMGGDIDVPEAANGANVSTMGGTITIGSAKQHVKAKTMGGNITIRQIDGSVRAETMGGDVEVKVLGGVSSGDHDVYLSSMGGDVTVHLPDQFSMNVDVDLAYTRGSDGPYEIVSDFPLKQSESEKWEHSKGDPRKHILGDGTFNGGKNTVHIKTTNGNVYLKKGG